MFARLSKSFFVGAVLALFVVTLGLNNQIEKQQVQIQILKIELVDSHKSLYELAQLQRDMEEAYQKLQETVKRNDEEISKINKTTKHAKSKK